MKKNDPEFEHARKLCIDYWKEIHRLRKVVLKQWGREDVHDLRVASRRFRAMLNLVMPMCDCKGTRRLGKEVRRLTGTLGNLRNFDEAVAFFETHGQGIDSSDIISRLYNHKMHEQETVSKTLKNFKPRKYEPSVHKITAAMTAKTCAAVKIPPLPAYLSDVSINLFNTVQSLLPSARCFENHEERHKLRIAIKKWRYFLEIASQVLESDFDATLVLLKKYQSLLGSMNDLSVFEKLFAEVVNSADERAALNQLIAHEHQKLFQEFIDLTVAAPLTYTFKA